MNRIRHTALLCLLLAPLAQVASASAAPKHTDTLDEVVVHGARLNEILLEMVQLEDQFFDQYNELNTNDDFDTHCYMEARIGTAIRRRFCRATYEAKALQVEGQDYALFLLNNFSADGGPSYKPTNDPPALKGGPPVAAKVTIEGRRKDYQQNIRDVVRAHPELLKMLKERYELGKRYEATRRKVWGLKPLPPEEAVAPVPAPP